MCGRFTLTVSPGKVADFFGLPQVPESAPRYNIAPTQPVVAIAAAASDAGLGRQVTWYRWGLIPFWATDLKIGNRLANARADTVATKPAFKQRRCLVLADGFCEWKATGGKKKRPYYFQLRDGQPFAFAGLWERWQKRDEDEILSCTLITTDPNDVVGQVHNRMPVVLPTSAYDQWLHMPAKEAAGLTELLRAYPGEGMPPASRRTSSARPAKRTPDAVGRHHVTLPLAAAHGPALPT
jgi:putative SOS response-associated peptidase YedK